jgi:hypothetical protein
MADFPTSIYNPRVKANKAGVVYDENKTTILFEEDTASLENEIKAIENELGTEPAGAFETVKAWLTSLGNSIVSVFTGLSDVPASYVDQAGKIVQVKATEDGLEFGNPAPSAFTGLSDVPASYVDQAGKIVQVKSAEDGLEFATAGGGGDYSFMRFRRMDQWHFSSPHNQSVTATACSANTMYASPIYFGKAVTVLEIGIKVTTGAAGSIRFGIYSDDGTIKPGALVSDCGTSACTNAGSKTVTGLSVSLLANTLYWLVIVSDVAPSVQRSNDSYSWFPLGGSACDKADTRGAWQRAFNYAALPDPWGASGDTDPNQRAIGVKI